MPLGFDDCNFRFNSKYFVCNVAEFCTSLLIAEEKERNTLRSLMMTPATTVDVLIGKSSLVFVMSVVILAIATYLYGYEPVSIWAFVANPSFNYSIHSGRDDFWFILQDGA